MAIFEYLSPVFLKKIYPDLKMKISERANATLIYSEKFNQIIYIKQLNKKKSVTPKYFLQKETGLRDKIINDAERKMQRLYGRKRGLQRYKDSFKLIVFTTPNISNHFWQYLWAINMKLKHEHKQIMYMVFETTKTPDKEITGIICGALTKQYKALYQISMQTANKTIKYPFGKLKLKLDDLKYALSKLESKYYECSSHDTLKKKFDETFAKYDYNIIIHNQTGQTIKAMDYHPTKIKFEKEPYKADVEVI